VSASKTARIYTLPNNLRQKHQQAPSAGRARNREIGRQRDAEM
jgi:hypothetical protein